jgi:hypothetical protein
MFPLHTMSHKRPPIWQPYVSKRKKVEKEKPVEHVPIVLSTQWIEDTTLPEEIQDRIRMRGKPCVIPHVHRIIKSSPSTTNDGHTCVNAIRWHPHHGKSFPL